MGNDKCAQCGGPLVEFVFSVDNYDRKDLCPIFQLIGSAPKWNDIKSFSFGPSEHTKSQLSEYAYMHRAVVCSPYSICWDALIEPIFNQIIELDGAYPLPGME